MDGKSAYSIMHRQRVYMNAPSSAHGDARAGQSGAPKDSDMARSASADYDQDGADEEPPHCVLALSFRNKRLGAAFSVQDRLYLMEDAEENYLFELVKVQQTSYPVDS